MHEIAANRQSRIALRKSLKYFLFQIDCTMYLPLPSPKNLVVSKLTGKSCGIFFLEKIVHVKSDVVWKLAFFVRLN